MDGDILYHQVVMVHTVWLTQCGKVSMHSTHWLVLCSYTMCCLITSLNNITPIYVVIVQHLSDTI